MKLDKLGWIVAAALAGGMVGMGFQGSSSKFGTVDIVKVFNECDLSKKNQDSLKSSQQNRLAILAFLNSNRAMLPVDAEKYAALSTKADRSATDKKELDRIAQDASAATAKQRDLATKPSPTADDQKQMQEFGTRAQQNVALQQRLSQQYDQELGDLQQTLRSDGLDKVRDAIKEVSNKQGYTVVFSQESAPFAANDLTADVLKVVNAKK